jgi:hypothetical protein
MRDFGHRRVRLGQGGQLIVARTNAVWLIFYAGLLSNDAEYVLCTTHAHSAISHLNAFKSLVQ